MEPNLSSAQRDAIQTEIFAGKKISAIKAYREATGAGLKDAKDAVEAMEAQLRTSSPGRFTAAPAKAGCLPMLLLFIVPVLLAAWLCRLV